MKVEYQILNIVILLCNSYLKEDVGTLFGILYEYNIYAFKKFTTLQYKSSYIT